MARQNVKASFWRGVTQALPFFVVIVPFAMLFGVVATEAGLNVFEALTFSVVVIAGASQFTAVQLLADGAPAWVALISALTINLRMAMYSASMTPHLGPAPPWTRVILAYFMLDQTYALAHVEYESKTLTLEEKIAYFFGIVVPIGIPWYIFTVLGAIIGKSIPSSYGLDFAVPIAFLAMIGPMLRTRAHMLAAFVAVVLALLFAWLPYNLGLMVGAFGGMITGAQVELMTTRRSPE